MKKVTALLLAVLMVVGLFAGCNSGGNGTATTAAPAAASTTAAPAKTTAAASTTAAAPADSGKLFAEPVTFNMWIMEHSSYLYNPESYLEGKMNELWNVYFDVTPFQDGLHDKIILGLASGDLPDMAHTITITQASEYGMQGALADLNQYADQMPTFTALRNSEMGNYCDYFTSSNGALYLLPHYNYCAVGDATMWMYRKDIFEKHNLAVPTTDVEVYEVCKELKALYPESAPFSNRSWPGIIDRIVYQWGSGYPMYYNNDQGAWTYGPMEESFEAMMAWLEKMYSEELVPTNWLSMDTASWQELVSANKGFIMNEYLSRIDFFNVPMRESDPTVCWYYMEPFTANNSGVTTLNPQSQLQAAGYVAFNTDNVENTIKLFDHFFTEEAKVLMNWGVEGETHEVTSDGARHFIGEAKGLDELRLASEFSFFQRGFYCYVDDAAILDASSVEKIEAFGYCKEDSGEFRVPSITFSEENKKVYDRLYENINVITTENLGKFMTGQRPMSEYDAFRAELEAAGIQELIDVHNKQQAEFDALMGK